MKKRFIAHILCAILFLLLSMSVYAQKEAGNVEIGGGIGAASSDYLFDGYSPGFMIGLGKQEYVNHKYSGAFFLTIKYHLTKRFAVGLVVAYENESGDWLKNYNPDHFAYRKMLIGTFKRQAFTFAPEISFDYSNKGIVRTYFSAGLGLTYRNEVDKYSTEYYYSSSNYSNGVNILGDNLELNNNTVHGNMYLSPFGISVGENIRWFAEIGIGYKGIINTGFTVKL